MGVSRCLFGAASSEQEIRALARSAHYYSSENLQRIVEQNAERAKNGEAPLDIHAPLVIFADPSDDEGEDDTENLAFILDIADLIRSPFNPIIVMSINSFKVLASQEKNALRRIIHEKYHVLTMRQGQHAVLVPHWYKAIFKGFYGFDMKISRELLSEMARDDWWDIWLLSKNIVRNPSVAKRNDEFVEDLKKIFIARRENQTPVWDICFMGHGSYKSKGDDPRTPHIGGLTRPAFIKALEFFNTGIKTGVVFVDSCYVGGGNARFVEKIIGRWKKPLNFDVIFASVGEVILGTLASPEPKEGGCDSQRCVILQTLFNDAAQLPWKKNDAAYKAGIKQLMKSRFLLSRSQFTQSLYRSEVISQIRPRFGTRVKFLRDVDPSIALIDAKKSSADVVKPGVTDTILAAVKEIDTLKLTPIRIDDGYTKIAFLKKMIELDRVIVAAEKEGDSEQATALTKQALGMAYQLPNYDLLYCVYQVSLGRLIADQALEQRIFTQRYPELILVTHQKHIDVPMNLHIKNLVLVSDDSYVGIHKFFIESFLSTFFYSTRRIIIDSLTGPNDIALFCKLSKAEKPGKYTVSSGDFDAEMPVGDPITVTDVVIEVSYQSMSVSFIFNGARYQLSIDLILRNKDPYKYKIRHLYEATQASPVQLIE